MTLQQTFNANKPQPGVEANAEMLAYASNNVTGRLLIKPSAFPFVRLEIDRGGGKVATIDFNASLDQLRMQQEKYAITDAEMADVRAVMASIWTNLP